jgi:hypothetical protein
MHSESIYWLCIAGWFNLLGQVAITAGIDFSLTNHIAAMWVLSNGYILSQKELLAVYGGTSVLASSRCPSHKWLGHGRVLRSAGFAKSLIDLHQNQNMCQPLGRNG